MKKRIISFALTLAMLLSMATVAFATEWETPIDVVQVAVVGDNAYATLEDAFADQIEAGAEYVSLSGDLTVGDLVLPENGVLNLNGFALTADSFDSIAPGAKIIDTTGGEGLLIVKGEYEFAENNPQLPVKDETAGGFRFLAVTVKSVAVSGKKTNSPKYWFQVKFENFDKVDALIAAGSELELKVLVNQDGVEAVATANRDFLLKWVETYKANNGIYITAQIADTEGKAISAIPAIGANGVDITGKTL